MRRGDIVTAATGSGFGGKPRPVLVIQADATIRNNVVVLLLSSDRAEATPIRPVIEPDAANGLLAPSDCMTDIPVTVPLAKVGRVIGRLADVDLLRVELALLTVLGFRG